MCLTYHASFVYIIIQFQARSPSPLDGDTDRTLSDGEELTLEDSQSSPLPEKSDPSKKKSKSKIVSDLKRLSLRMIYEGFLCWNAP